MKAGRAARKAKLDEVLPKKSNADSDLPRYEEASAKARVEAYDLPQVRDGRWS